MVGGATLPERSAPAPRLALRCSPPAHSKCAFFEITYPFLLLKLVPSRAGGPMRLAMILFCAFLFAGCSLGASKHREAELASGGGAEAPAEFAIKREALAKSSVYMDQANSIALMSNEPPPPIEAVTPGTHTGRMLYYNGGIDLKATQPENTLDTASAWVKVLGGYVEERSANHAVLRIPVAHFRNFFEKAQTLGTLQNKWMRADDITDAFQDNELRIKIAEATLSRLQELLAASTNEDEKIRLLREIQRVSDELEGRRNRQAILARQATYSRLDLNVQPFVFETGRTDMGIKAFTWFAELSAQREKETFLGKKAEFSVPSGLVELKLKKTWATRSADGVDFWAFRRKNEPCGDATFWNAALHNSLGPSFAKSETFQAGSFAVLRLESFGPSAYIWWIATWSDGKKLYVAEAYFPDLQAEKRHGEAIRQSLAGGVQ